VLPQEAGFEEVDLSWLSRHGSTVGFVHLPPLRDCTDGADVTYYAPIDS
jgi:hypothetical protein